MYWATSFVRPLQFAQHKKQSMVIAVLNRRFDGKFFWLFLIIQRFANAEKAELKRPINVSCKSDISVQPDHR